MRTPNLVSASAAIVLATAAANAQQQDAGGLDPQSVLVEVQGRDDQVVPRFNVSIERLRGMAVHGSQGESIGEIEEVLATAGGEVAAVTIEIGGFLGVRERQIVVNLDEIRLDGLRLTIDATREHIEGLPQWGG